VALEGLPSSRQSLLGISHEGDEVWLIRGIAQTVMRIGGTEHRHWHRSCAKRILEPGLSRVKAVNARESGRTKLESRGKRPAGKRGRRTPRR
jgi:hypothetical protein